MHAQVIIFSFSKKECESLALKMAALDLTDDNEKQLIDTIYNSAIDCLSPVSRQLPTNLHSFGVFLDWLPLFVFASFFLLVAGEQQRATPYYPDSIETGGCVLRHERSLTPLYILCIYRKCKCIYGTYMYPRIETGGRVLRHEHSSTPLY